MSRVELDSMRTDERSVTNRALGTMNSVTRLHGVANEAFIALGAQFPTGQYNTAEDEGTTTTWFRVNYVGVTEPKKIYMEWIFFAENSEETAYLVVSE